MKLLAVDCSTEACSVAIYENDLAQPVANGRVIAEQYLLTPREHTQRLLPMIDAVLVEAEVQLSELDAIAFGRGPGSFTGLRIALGAVQGLAFGAELPVLPVSTLTALAQTAVEEGLIAGDTALPVISAIDARMDELYWSVCHLQEGVAVNIGAEHLGSPEMLSPQDADGVGLVPGGVGVGSGWQFASRIPVAAGLGQLLPTCLPKARAIARLADREWRLGGMVAAEQALPVYLRDEVAWQKSSSLG